MARLTLLIVSGLPAYIPDWLSSKGWSLHSKGYLIYTSRRTLNPPYKRGKRAHIAVMEKLLGAPLDPSFHIHHQDFNKLHNCPHNLVYLPAAFNPTQQFRDPYTGRTISRSDYAKYYSVPASSPVAPSSLPDWVTAEPLSSNELENEPHAE